RRDQRAPRFALERLVAVRAPDCGPEMLRARDFLLRERGFEGVDEAGIGKDAHPELRLPGRATLEARLEPQRQPQEWKSIVAGRDPLARIRERREVAQGRGLGCAEFLDLLTDLVAPRPRVAQVFLKPRALRALRRTRNAVERREIALGATHGLAREQR